MYMYSLIFCNYNERVEPSSKPHFRFNTRKAGDFCPHLFSSVVTIHQERHYAASKAIPYLIHNASSYLKHDAAFTRLQWWGSPVFVCQMLRQLYYRHVPSLRLTVFCCVSVQVLIYKIFGFFFGEGEEIFSLTLAFPPCSIFWFWSHIRLCCCHIHTSL